MVLLARIAALEAHVQARHDAKRAMRRTQLTAGGGLCCFSGSSMSQLSLARQMQLAWLATFVHGYGQLPSEFTATDWVLASHRTLTPTAAFNTIDIPS
mmetsp:Transcript_22830/g.58126  ORF Transcript_22830/g.58126 Transcript_22830/m.58126 type:complete len:98 (-) Transcript_22830:121-414(-)